MFNSNSPRCILVSRRAVKLSTDSYLQILICSSYYGVCVVCVWFCFFRCVCGFVSVCAACVNCFSQASALKIATGMATSGAETIVSGKLRIYNCLWPAGPLWCRECSVYKNKTRGRHIPIAARFDNFYISILIGPGDILCWSHVVSSRSDAFQKFPIFLARLAVGGSLPLCRFSACLRVARVARPVCLCVALWSGGRAPGGAVKCNSRRKLRKLVFFGTP